MHSACSVDCMKAAGVKPYPARHAFKDRRGILWLLTNEQTADLLTRVFPEGFGGRRAEAKKVHS